MRIFKSEVREMKKDGKGEDAEGAAGPVEGRVVNHPHAKPAEPTDGTDVSAKAAVYAVKLAKKIGAKVTAVTVTTPAESMMIGEVQIVRDREAYERQASAQAKAMLDVVDVPVTVKHRIGIDKIESYDFVRDFVGTVSEAGCKVFIVHARNAWLDGLSPKENREIPPLRYELAYHLKKDFPGLLIAVNGGIKTNAEIAAHLQQADGVMIGREAYYNPWLLSTWDAEFYGDTHDVPSREAVEEAMVAYMERAFAEDGCPWYAIARHMLGLYHGQRGGRYWRQVWSNHKLKPLPPREVWQQAREALARGAEVPV